MENIQEDRKDIELSALMQEVDSVLTYLETEVRTKRKEEAFISFIYENELSIDVKSGLARRNMSS